MTPNLQNQTFEYVIYANFDDKELESIHLIDFMDFEETPEWLNIEVLIDPAEVQNSKNQLLDPQLKEDIINESDKEVVERSINAQHSITIKGGVINPKNGLDNYIEVIIMLEIILASYTDCVSVLDLKTDTLLSRNEWLKQVVTNLSDDIFEIRDHVLTLSSEQEDQSTWIYTSGMVKFGKPELSIHGIDADEEEKMIELVNDLAAELVYKNTLPQDKAEITVDDMPQGLIASYQDDCIELTKETTTA